MRIEREGHVSNLTPRIRQFILDELGGVDLDKISHPEARRVDFVGFRGLLVIELKSLEEDGSERMGNLLNQLRKRDDWPNFWGNVPVESYLSHIDDKDVVRRSIVDRIGRSLKNHIQKANKQFDAHSKANPRRHSFNVLFLLNEDHEIYEPSIVGYTVRKLLYQTDSDKLRYPNIDSVLYFTERHATSYNGTIAFPILQIEGFSTSQSYWKCRVLDLIVQRWGNFNRSPTYHEEYHSLNFSTVEHVNKNMKRYELWELQYKRDPYMQNFTNRQVEDCFDETYCVALLAFLKNSPFKPTDEAIKLCMQTTSHLMIEMGRRAIAPPKLGPNSARLTSAALRLRLPASVITWIQNRFLV